MGWKGFHFVVTLMFAVSSFKLLFEKDVGPAMVGLVFTYFYWHFLYRRSARKALAQDNLDRFFRENGITSSRMVKGPHLIIAVNSAVDKLFVYPYKNYPNMLPSAFGPGEILDVQLIELTKTRKEESGGWMSGLVGALLGGGPLGFFLGFLFERKTQMKTIVTGYQIKITVRSTGNPVYYLNFSNRKEAEYWRRLLMVASAGGKAQ